MKEHFPLLLALSPAAVGLVLAAIGRATIDQVQDMILVSLAAFNYLQSKRLTTIERGIR